MSVSTPVPPPPAPPPIDHGFRKPKITIDHQKLVQGDIPNDLGNGEPDSVPTNSNEKDLASLLYKSIQILPDPWRNRVYYAWYHKTIQPQIQDGPKCGLVALSMAIHVKVDLLHEVSRTMGISCYGEMFSAQWLCDLVNNPIVSCQHNCVAKCFTTTDSLFTWENLRSWFQNDCFILFPYDLGGNLKIGFSDGKKAHWVLLIGLMSDKSSESKSQPVVCIDKSFDNTQLQLNVSVWDDEGSGSNDPDESFHKCKELLERCEQSSNLTEKDFTDTSEQKCVYQNEGAETVGEGETTYLLGFHGKSKRMCIYDKQELMKSNAQLNQPGKTEVDGFIIPHEGLPNSLASKFVLLVPRRQRVS